MSKALEKFEKNYSNAMNAHIHEKKEKQAEYKRKLNEIHQIENMSKQFNADKKAAANYQQYLDNWLIKKDELEEAHKRNRPAMSEAMNAELDARQQAVANRRKEERFREDMAAAGDSETERAAIIQAYSSKSRKNRKNRKNRRNTRRN